MCHLRSALQANEILWKPYPSKLCYSYISGHVSRYKSRSFSSSPLLQSVFSTPRFLTDNSPGNSSSSSIVKAERTAPFITCAQQWGITTTHCSSSMRRGWMWKCYKFYSCHKSSILKVYPNFLPQRGTWIYRQHVKTSGKHLWVQVAPQRNSEQLKYMVIYGMVRYYGKLSPTLFMVACSSLSPALESQRVHMVRERLSGREDGWAPVSGSQRQSCAKSEIVHTRQWEVKITSPSTPPSVDDSSPPGWNPVISAPKHFSLWKTFVGNNMGRVGVCEPPL